MTSWIMVPLGEEGGVLLPPFEGNDKVAEYLKANYSEFLAERDAKAAEKE